MSYESQLGQNVSEAMKKWRAAGKEAPANEAVFLVRLKQMLAQINEDLVLEVKDATTVSHFQKRILTVRISNLSFARFTVDFGEADGLFTTTPSLEECQKIITRQIVETCERIKEM